MLLQRTALLGALTTLVATGCGGNAAPSSPTNAPSATALASLPPASSGCPTIGTANDHGSAPAAAGRPITVDIGDSYFSPTCLTGVTSGTVTVHLTNSGSALHNFSIPGQNIDSDIAPGQSLTVTVQVGSAPLSYFCKYHRTSGMIGQFAPATP